MKASRLTTQLAALAGALLVSSGTPVHANDIPRPAVPADLDPADDSRAYLVGYAIGTQDYVCLPNGSGLAWVQYWPQATLFSDDGGQIATHFLSPNPDEHGTPRATWQHSRNTSAVWAKQYKISTDSDYVEPGAIPVAALGSGRDRARDRRRPPAQRHRLVREWGRRREELRSDRSTVTQRA